MQPLVLIALGAATEARNRLALHKEILHDSPAQVKQAMMAADLFTHDLVDRGVLAQEGAGNRGYAEIFTRAASATAAGFPDFNC